MARTYRDAYGVPHIRADSVLDLARGQGEVTARDRTWQLEWLRRRATGTTAELFGDVALGWDRFARRTMVADTARRAHAACSPETQAFVAAYVEGVNAGLSAAGRGAPELRELGVDSQPWEEWTPAATFLAQHILFAGLAGKLWSALTRAVLGDDASLLSHEGPVSSGSNAWAVGGGRTASGLPLIGGDPHRIIESPGVYQQVRLACEAGDDSFDVVGLAFPGVPGVPHFGHAGEVAWAITNAVGNYQDVHDEASPPRDVVEQRIETVAVRGAEPVEVEVVLTERGAVFEEGRSVSTSSLVLGELGFDALLPLLRARSTDDIDQALDHWVEPVNNVVVADRAGAVRYRIAGRVPTRNPSGAWTGWQADVHRDDVAADGQVVTANERRGPQSAEIGREFAPPYRADRIHALLHGRSELTPADFAAIHNDALLGTVPQLRVLVPGVFDDFDGRMEAGSAQAAAFAAWRSALVRRIAAEAVLAPLLDPPPEHRHDALFAPWLDATSRIALALPSLVAAGTPYGIDLRALARLALEDSRGHPATWGATHVATPVHAFEPMGRGAPELPRPALSGDSDCVRCTGSYPAQTDECYRGSVARYVWDLADREASGWVVPLGAAGEPGGPHHHDQLALWAAGELAPVVTDWDRLEEEHRPRPVARRDGGGTQGE